MRHIGYFDVHLCGADPVKGITEETITKDIMNNTIKVILYGDIVDRKNSLEKFVDDCTRIIGKFKKLLGDFFKTGNHEADRDEDVPTLYKGWLNCHTDMIFNGPEESKLDRQTKWGRGRFSRLYKGLASKARDAGILDFHANLDNPEFQARFISYCEKYGAEKGKGIIGGHKHPNEKIVKKIGDYVLVIYPRGRHEVTELSE